MWWCLLLVIFILEKGTLRLLVLVFRSWAFWFHALLPPPPLTPALLSCPIPQLRYLHSGWLLSTFLLWISFAIFCHLSSLTPPLFCISSSISRGIFKFYIYFPQRSSLNLCNFPLCTNKMLGERVSSWVFYPEATCTLLSLFLKAAPIAPRVCWCLKRL